MSEPITIGSLTVWRAANSARELSESAPGASITGAGNLAAAKQAEVVIITVPYEAQGPLLESARYVEELTALLLNINRIYKAHSTIRIVGL